MMNKVSLKEITTKQGTKHKGDVAEKIAQRFLSKKGLKFYRAKERLLKDEIDLIFKEDDCWVLVEVRYRRQENMATGLESIAGKKLHYMKRAARQFEKHPLYRKEPSGIRIDIVSISGNLEAANIHWTPNAISFD